MTLTRRKDPVTYIPMAKAMETYHLAADQVQQAIDTGQIETAKLDDGSPLLLDESLRQWVAGQQVSRSKFDHLKGKGISITEAARKYKFDPHSIRVWIERGYVHELGKVSAGRRKRLIDEADVAYARALADLKQPIAGQGVF